MRNGLGKSFFDDSAGCALQLSLNDAVSGNGSPTTKDLWLVPSSLLLPFLGMGWYLHGSERLIVMAPFEMTVSVRLPLTAPAPILALETACMKAAYAMMVSVRILI